MLNMNRAVRALGLAAVLTGSSAGIAASVNVAPLGTASQSSTLSSFEAALGIDGNLGNFTHTIAGNNLPSTWQVALPSSYQFETIVLHNRDNCCGARLRDITVEVLDSSGSAVYTSPLLNPENVDNSPQTITLDLAALTGGRVGGRAIRVIRTPDPDFSGGGSGTNPDDADVLSLGEVQAFTTFKAASSIAPGGLDVADPGLVYHLDAGRGVTADGSNRVSGWADQSGNGRNFLQDSAGKQPLLVTGGIGSNNLPAVRFDGDASDHSGGVGPNSDRLVLDDATSVQTFIIVNRPDADNGGNAGLIGLNDSDIGIRMRNASEWQTQSTSNDNDFTKPAGSTVHVNGDMTGTIPAGPGHILSETRAGGAYTFSATGLGEYFLNSSHAPRPYAGDVAEVLAFNRALNTAERTVVENALSSKYAIAISNDRFVGDEAGFGDYDGDVFGVGRDDVDNELLETAAAGLNITALNGSLDDGEYVMAGHKAIANGTTATGLASGKRWERVWYLDETGEVDIALTFDFTDAGLTPLSSDLDYRLLFSTTDGGTFSELDLDPTLNGDQVTFVLTGTDLVDGYYTLAIPEPAMFSTFAAGLLMMTRRRR